MKPLKLYFKTVWKCGEMSIKNVRVGNSLLAHWLTLSASTAWGTGSIPGGGAEVPQVSRCSLK